MPYDSKENQEKVKEKNPGPARPAPKSFKILGGRLQKAIKSMKMIGDFQNFRKFTRSSETPQTFSETFHENLGTPDFPRNFRKNAFSVAWNE